MSENQQMDAGVSALRDKFSEWLKGHLPITRYVGVKTTLWFGVMQKCCNYVDALVASCLRKLSPLAGGAGESLVERTSAGKPLDRLTLGQCVHLLDALDTA